ncbi:DNA-directed RNA polymerase subunit beta [Candidatus Shikimatogenerans bostrichidophilus]|uniref:DNA-directed RNA polymerase subunit beta n=1 Tax=Candidatus Shikimatogenerans bostrichidophilus TaxID=2943807 RepID=UPI002966702B
MYKKKIYFTKENINFPDFLLPQLKSFNNFINLNNYKKYSLYKILNNIFPIYNKKKNISLKLLNYYIEQPKYSINECIKYKLTYNISLILKLKLSYKNKSIIEKVYLGTCPLITSKGSFIINGNERVIVFQIHRSPGLFFGIYKEKSYYAKIIPKKGSWLEFNLNKNNILYLIIDKKKKIPLTIFLKAIGYKSEKKLMKIFNVIKKIEVINSINTKNAFDIIKNNKILIKKNNIINFNNIKLLLKNNINKIYIIKNFIEYNIYINTIKKDLYKTHKLSLNYIYYLFNNNLPPNYNIAKNFIYNKFFSKKNYNLGKIGRYRLNNKLNINNNSNLKTINYIDIKFIIKNLINFFISKNDIDDIDSLSNRKIKTIGDHLYSLFNIGFKRLANIIKDKLNSNLKNLTPKKLINSKILSSLINSFFCTSPFSQYLDQTNPLSEITHKRRLTLLGPGGLIKDRASFEVRDVNYSHYGRLCPIETPEGPNIGLIYSLCLFTKINKMGVLISPYYKITNGKISKKKIYLTSDEEFNKIIVPYNINIKKDIIIGRKNNECNFFKKQNINYKDYYYNQMLSISASLIPFIEHDDANRALMGSNMMRQAIPLLKLEPPIVGTGIEKKVIFYSRNYINAKSQGIVKYVDSNRIIIKYNYTNNNLNLNKKYYIHKLKKFKKTNQNTCINLKPIVKKGQKIKKNQILCEGFGNKNGELALGKNLLVAFMTWKGYNFEDAIIVSKRIIKNDSFTSIHIEEFTLELKHNKLGNEEFTNDIPNLNKYETKYLNKNGLIKIGTYVKPGDILIGKIAPKEKSIISPEEKLLKLIFGNKANQVIDKSLRAHSSLYGVVIKSEILNKNIKKMKLNFNKQKKKLYKFFLIKIYNIIKNCKLKINNIKINNLNKKKFINKIHKLLLKYNKYFIYLFDLNKKNIITINSLINNYNFKIKSLINKFKIKKYKYQIGEDLSNDIIKVAKVTIAIKRKLKVGDKMSGRHGNKGVIAKILNEEDMPYLKDGSIIDIILNPLSVPSRMNIGQILESILGYIGYKKQISFYSPVFNGFSIKNINKYYKKYIKLKKYCRTDLYDGLTGEKFNNKVTIGVIYMLKLGHMVEDKIHSRSIGPYSLITQQPLGGKSQYGGQRFGEMEVWALEAYGASNILRELLTIKSDDIIGRKKTYEAIVKGKKLPNPGIPESLNVLIKELKGLCLNIKLNKFNKNNKLNKLNKLKILKIKNKLKLFKHFKYLFKYLNHFTLLNEYNKFKLLKLLNNFYFFKKIKKLNFLKKILNLFNIFSLFNKFKKNNKNNIFKQLNILNNLIKKIKKNKKKKIDKKKLKKFNKKFNKFN